MCTHLQTDPSKQQAVHIQNTLSHQPPLPTSCAESDAHLLLHEDLIERERLQLGIDKKRLVVRAQAVRQGVERANSELFSMKEQAAQEAKRM